MPKKKNLVSLDEFIDKEIGKTGTDARKQFDKGYMKFRNSIPEEDTTIREFGTDGASVPGWDKAEENIYQDYLP